MQKKMNVEDARSKMVGKFYKKQSRSCGLFKTKKV